jgi:hypothetical protein
VSIRIQEFPKTSIPCVTFFDIVAERDYASAGVTFLPPKLAHQLITVVRSNTALIQTAVRVT